MKVAFVSTILCYPWGGADTLWTRAAEAASARGDTLLLSLSPATAAHPRIGALQSGGARLHLRLPPAGPPRLARRLWARVRPPVDPLLPALRAFAPDLVVFSFGGTYDVLMHPEVFRWLEQARVPYRIIANWQKELPDLAAADLASVQAAFAAADSLNFVSSRNLATTRRHLLMPLENARVLHNPLRGSPADFTPFPSDAAPRLATVGRLEPVKGLDLLLHAAAEALGTEQNWSLHVFGRGPQEAALRAIASHLGIGRQVVFRGHVDTPLAELWRDRHLLVSPSVDEGVPMTIPEAMFCGRPVLATCVGGAEDWIQDNETGFICPAPTIPLLAATLKRAVSARDRWPTMGTAAHTAATARYRPDDFIKLIG
jgi:glycosyltransferase involved in cell wall biosynthesis